jgi:Lon protease-like protein
MGALDESALAALPIFPLPDVVLFPGALLPLHVFEPRYRELTADVLAGSKIMAVSRLRPGYEQDYRGRPPVFDTIGAGYVIAHEQLDDGRYNILLRGVARVRVDEELPAERAYRQVRGHVLLDTRSRRPDVLEDRQQQLIAMCDRLSLAMKEGGAQLRELARAAPSPGGCADVLSAALVLDPDARQTLLETTDPADRLETVTEHVAMLLTRMASPGDLSN